RQLIERGAPEARTSVISNGVSLTRFRRAVSTAEVDELRQKHGLPRGVPLVLFVGLLIERKGVVELLEAWMEHRKAGGKAALALVGQDLRMEGDEAFRRAWETRLAEARGLGGVFILPPTNSIEEIYRASDVFAFLSKVEGMPNVIPEAMASG